MQFDPFLTAPTTAGSLLSDVEPGTVKGAGDAGTSTDLATTTPGALTGPGGMSFAPSMALDVHEDDQNYELTADVPGVPKENVHVEVRM